MNVAWGRFRPAHRAGRFDRLFESHRQRRTPLPSGDVDVFAAHNRGRCRAGACRKGEEKDDLTHSLIGIGRPLLTYRPCDSVKAARFVIIVNLPIRYWERRGNAAFGSAVEAVLVDSSARDLPITPFYFFRTAAMSQLSRSPILASSISAGGHSDRIFGSNA